MHELSIVMSIVATAEEQVEKHRAKKVEKIKLSIGTLSGIDRHALDFAWKVGVKNSVLEWATCEVESIPAVALCTDCGHEFEITEYYGQCPLCGNYFLDIKQGKEIKIMSLTLIE